MNSHLEHIFDKSACLTCRQMRDYINGQMATEECHTAEHHLSNCLLCSEALEGLQAYPAEASEILSVLNSRFLMEYFNMAQAQPGHKTAKSAAEPQQHTGKKRALKVTTALFIAVGLVILVYMGYYRSAHPENRETNVPAETKMAPAISQPKPQNIDYNVSEVPEEKLQQKKPVATPWIAKKRTKNNSPAPIEGKRKKIIFAPHDEPSDEPVIIMVNGTATTGKTTR